VNLPNEDGKEFYIIIMQKKGLKSLSVTSKKYHNFLNLNKFYFTKKMSPDRYLEIRNCYKYFVNEILDETSNSGILVKKAAKKLGLFYDNTLIIDNDDESNVLMDYVLYEKNGMPNRVVDRFYKLFGNKIDETRKIILNGMLNNHYSVFEITSINSDLYTLQLFDLIGKQTYALMDIGFSTTAKVGAILATRLIPTENINITSGQSSVFQEEKRVRLLADISKKNKNRPRKRSIKIKSRKSDRKTLQEVVFILNKKYGIQILTIDPT